MSVSLVVPSCLRRSLAAGLVAVALISVAAPALVCVLFGRSRLHSHSCCEPATNLQGDRPASSENSCCVTVATESSSVPVAVLKCAPQAALVVACGDVPVVPDSRPFVSAPAEGVFFPPCSSPSVLRV